MTSEFRFDSEQVQISSLYIQCPDRSSGDRPISARILNLTIRLGGVAICQSRSHYPHETGGMLGPTATTERYSREEKIQSLSGNEHWSYYSLITIPAPVSSGNSEVKYIAYVSIFGI